jgi:hypothetical protein
LGGVPFEILKGAVMSENASHTGILKIGDVEAALSPIPLPVVYFDGSPSVSHLNGIIGVTLVVTGNVPLSDKGIQMVASVVAHLKCNIPAAVALRNALNDALLLAQPVEKSEGPAN